MLWPLCTYDRTFLGAHKGTMVQCIITLICYQMHPSVISQGFNNTKIGSIAVEMRGGMSKLGGSPGTDFSQ